MERRGEYAKAFSTNHLESAVDELDHHIDGELHAILTFDLVESNHV